MFYTEIGLTQYELHDDLSFLNRYNEDMRTITNTVTVASGEMKRVEQEFTDEIERIDNNFIELDNKVDTIASKIPPIVASVSVVSGRLDVVEMKTAGLEVTTTSISNKLIEHITTSTSVMAGIVEEVKTGDAALDLKIMADRERIAVNETKIAENAADIEALQNSNSALEPRVEANENAIDALRQVDSEQGQAIQTEHNTNATQTSQIAGLLTNVQGLSSGMDNLRQDVEDLQSNINYITQVKLPIGFDRAMLYLNSVRILMEQFTLESDNPKNMEGFKIRVGTNTWRQMPISDSIACWSANNIDVNLSFITEAVTFGEFIIYGLNNLVGSILTLTGFLICQGNEGHPGYISLAGSMAIEIFSDTIPIVIMTKLPSSGTINKILSGNIVLTIN